jgi:2-furoyl-CoA dehydrogenase FAD binding subunit
MKPAPFAYVRAESLDHAVEVLREHGDEAKPLAGGQSLVPALNMRLARPSVVVDLNRLVGLDAIGEDDGWINVGALARQSSVLRADLVRGRCPLLAEALAFVGHVVTRNRGTLGGSIAHADAAAELPLALVTLGGSVVTSRRVLAADEFFVASFITALEPDELLLSTKWPAPRLGEGSAFQEFAPRHGDFALAAAACNLRVENGVVAEARLAVNAVTQRPELVDTASLVGHTVDDEAARELGATAAAMVDPPPNLHGSPEYRRSLVATLAARAVTRAWERGAA